MSDIILAPDRRFALRSAIGSTVMFAVIVGIFNLISPSLNAWGFALMIGIYLLLMLAFALLIESRRHWTVGAGKITAANGTEFPLRADTEAQIRWGMLILRNPGGARLSMRNLPDPQAAADQILDRARQVQG